MTSERDDGVVNWMEEVAVDPHIEGYLDVTGMPYRKDRNGALWAPKWVEELWHRVHFANDRDKTAPFQNAKTSEEIDVLFVLLALTGRPKLEHCVPFKVGI